MVWVIPIGGKLAGKIWDTVDKFGTGILRPTQIKRVTKARAEAQRIMALSVAKAELEVAQIRAGAAILSHDGKLLSNPAKLTVSDDLAQLQSPADIEEMSELTQILREQNANAMLDQLRKAINLSKIIIEADKVAEKTSDESVSDEDVSEDWFFKWKGRAEEISDEDMQKIWARLLAGEARAPKSFSIHALNLLSSFSKQDAELLEKIGSLSIGEYILKGDGKFFESIGLNYRNILYLESINVLSGVTAMGGLTHQYVPQLSSSIPHTKYIIVPNRPLAYLATFAASKNDLVSLSCYGITKPAQELLTLCDPVQIDGYNVEIAKAFKKQGALSVKYGPGIFNGIQTAVMEDLLTEITVP